MINEELAISDFMPSEEKCFEHLRRTRWPNGVVCPKCGSKEIKKNGTENGSQRYCYGHDGTFSDTTDTVFYRSKYVIGDDVLKIAIMGTGSIGGYFGGRLAKAGEDVVFIARGAQLQALRKLGLTVRSVFGDFHLPEVRATDNPVEVGTMDLILVCVKAYDTDTAAKSIKTMVGGTTAVISL